MGVMPNLVPPEARRMKRRVVPRPTSRSRRGATAGRPVARTVHSTSGPALVESPPTQAFVELLDAAHDSTLRIPPEFLVEHLLAVTEDADWPVQRAALAALVRRCRFATRDELRVATHPKGSPFGRYTTRRLRQKPRPYSTQLTSLVPLRGSCDCPDYLRNSLGLCKHLLVVLDNLAARPRRWQRALGAPPRRVPPAGYLAWDPIRPLVGSGDWLARIQWTGLAEGTAVAGDDQTLALRWFRPTPREGLAIAATYADQPEKRGALVEGLLRASRNSRAGRRIDTEPAVRALLAAEHDRLRRVIADRHDLPELERALRSLHRKLYPYQMEGVRRVLAAGRLLLADDMGLGKTVQAVAVCHALWHTKKVRRGLLIVPATLKPQWQREWRLFSNAPIEIVDGPPEQRRACFKKRAGFLVVNYEQVIRDLPWMREWRPQIVVLDEAQRIKNWATKTAACVKQFDSPYRLVLTGTPMENRLDELASVLEWIDDHALEPRWRLAAWHYAAATEGRDSTGGRNLDTLRERLTPSMLRRVRQQVLHQLPPRTDTTVPVTLTEDQRDAHDALRPPIAQLASIGQVRPLRPPEFLRLMQLLMTQRIISNGLAQAQFTAFWPRLARNPRPDEGTLRELHSPKLFELREIVAQIAIEQQRKIVVFSQWRRMLALANWAVGDLLNDAGLRAAFFTGKEGRQVRTQNIVEFHDDPAVRVLFATDAGGVGLNLQRAASCCVNLELPWNPAVLEQRIGRIFRLGQRHPIDVYNLVGQDCIESRIASIVSGKRAFFTGLFDGKTDTVRFERATSFLSDLQQLAGTAQPLAPAAMDEEDSAIDVVPSNDAEREIDAVVAAGDEALDADLETPSITESQALPPPAAHLPPDRPRPAGPPAQPEGPPEQQPVPASKPAAAFATTDAGQLLSRVSVRRTAEGALRIEAPAETAGTLAVLFDALAQALRAAAEEESR
jgi:SNF2-related domain/Helicase conserved C-terminal domain